MGFPLHNGALRLSDIDMAHGLKPGSTFLMKWLILRTLPPFTAKFLEERPWTISSVSQNFPRTRQLTHLACSPQL